MHPASAHYAEDSVGIPLEYRRATVFQRYSDAVPSLMRSSSVCDRRVLPGVHTPLHEKTAGNHEVSTAVPCCTQRLTVHRFPPVTTTVRLGPSQRTLASEAGSRNRIGT